MFGVSTDGPYSHERFAAESDVSYPLLTDDDMRLYDRFGMVDVDEDGIRQPERGLVVVDADGTVAYE